MNPLRVGSVPAEEKIKSFAEMPDIIRRLRDTGKEVVLAQGVFDILHRGHVGYLRASYRFIPENCFLIVGVENDESVRRNKSAKRPINPLRDRLHVLSECMSVSFVFGYKDSPDYNNPDDFIKRYKALQAPAISIPTWDPYRKLKEQQAETANSPILLVDYHHTNSTTKMLQRLGYE
jgi:D-beta-D-heptose 7-phosphate kinase/D-beta-D-heptose 1-phosphate adenosyltransferase